MSARRVPTAIRALVGAVVAAVLLAGCFGGNSEPSKKFASRPTTGLAAKLEPPPKYSGPGGSTWARDYTPSTAQYLKQFYAPQFRGPIRTRLEQDGLREVVHSLWITDEQVQNDVVVLRFATAAGAAQRLAFTNGVNKGNSTLSSYRLDFPGSPIVYYSETASDDGFLPAKSYAQTGPYVVEMFTFAPTTIPRLQINRWLQTQVELLD